MSLTFDKERLPIICGEFPKELDSAFERLNITLEEAEQWFKDNCPEMVDYGKMVGAEPWTYGSKFVYEDPDGYFYEYAIRCFQELGALKHLYDSGCINPTPVRVGQVIYIVDHREVVELVVKEIRMTEDETVFMFSNGDTSTIEEFNRTWFSERERAETLLTDLEMVRIGLLFPE